MSAGVYAQTAATRVGEDGYGAHQLYYRSLANAVMKPDPYKRSRIRTSQSVGAWVPERQMRQIYSDSFLATTELLPTKCIWKDKNPCQYNPLRTHYYDPIFAAEDFTRKTS